MIAYELHEENEEKKTLKELRDFMKTVSPQNSDGHDHARS